jgi:hypothetical protein
MHDKQAQIPHKSQLFAADQEPIWQGMPQPIIFAFTCASSDCGRRGALTPIEVHGPKP